MTAKEYLRQLYRLNDFIKDNVDEVKRLKELAVTISAIDYSKVIVQASAKNEASFVNILYKIDELTEKINKKSEEMLNMKSEIKSKIEEIQDVDERLILIKRYLNFKKWEEISCEMNFSLRSILRLHKKALIDFEKLSLNAIV